MGHVRRVNLAQRRPRTGRKDRTADKARALIGPTDPIARRALLVRIALRVPQAQHARVAPNAAHAQA